MKIQVIFGEYVESDFTCKRCGGTGTEHGAFACLFCGGAGRLDLPRTYTYEGPATTRLWEHMRASGKDVTVVALSSDYEGPLREAYPLPPTTGSCEACGAPDIPLRDAACGSCIARLPEELRTPLGQGSVFARVGAAGRAKAWLKAHPKASDRPHLSECALHTHPEVGCTCSAGAPEWTL